MQVLALKPMKPASRKINEIERLRLFDLNIFERAARQKGFSVIAGIDEAGRGPLAGPVVAAACVIPADVFIEGVDDSKKLTVMKRQEIFERLMADSRLSYGVGIISHQQIDEINILQATILAMLQAVASLCCVPDWLLVDGLKLNHPSIPSEKIIAGDQKSQSIAAASIIAKETRDRLMVEYDAQWPQYGFARHKGYGTVAHLAALAKYGPSPIHRRSFSPIKEPLNACV